MLLATGHSTTQATGGSSSGRSLPAVRPRARGSSVGVEEIVLTDDDRHAIMQRYQLDKWAKTTRGTRASNLETWARLLAL